MVEDFAVEEGGCFMVEDFAVEEGGCFMVVAELETSGAKLEAFEVEDQVTCEPNREAFTEEAVVDGDDQDWEAVVDGDDQDWEAWD